MPPFQHVRVCAAACAAAVATHSVEGEVEPTEGLGLVLPEVRLQGRGEF